MQLPTEVYAPPPSEESVGTQTAPADSVLQPSEGEAAFRGNVVLARVEALQGSAEARTRR